MHTCYILQTELGISNHIHAHRHKHTLHTYTHTMLLLLAFKYRVVKLEKKQGEQVQGRVRGRKAKSGQLYLLSQKIYVINRTKEPVNLFVNFVKVVQRLNTRHNLFFTSSF